MRARRSFARSVLLPVAAVWLPPASPSCVADFQTETLSHPSPRPSLHSLRRALSSGCSSAADDDADCTVGCARCDSEAWRSPLLSLLGVNVCALGDTCQDFALPLAARRRSTRTGATRRTPSPPPRPPPPCSHNACALLRLRRAAPVAAGPRRHGARARTRKRGRARRLRSSRLARRRSASSPPTAFGYGKCLCGWAGRR